MKHDAFYDRLKSQTENWDPHTLDPSYKLIQESVRALKSVPLEQIDVADLDMLYIMSVGTWGSSVRNKKKKIAASHLTDEEKKRLYDLLDEIVEETKAGKYAHHQEEGESFGFFGRGFGTFNRGKEPYPPEHARVLLRCAVTFSMKRTRKKSLYSRATQFSSLSASNSKTDGVITRTRSLDSRSAGLIVLS